VDAKPNIHAFKTQKPSFFIQFLRNKFPKYTITIKRTTASKEVNVKSSYFTKKCPYKNHSDLKILDF